MNQDQISRPILHAHVSKCPHELHLCQWYYAWANYGYNIGTLQNSTDLSLWLNRAVYIFGGLERWYWNGGMDWNNAHAYFQLTSSKMPEPLTTITKYIKVKVPHMAPSMRCYVPSYLSCIESAQTLRSVRNPDLPDFLELL